MKIYTYRTIIEPDEKGYHGFVPLLKGVHTVGKTVEETKNNKDGITPPQEKDSLDSLEVIQTITINA